MTSKIIWIAAMSFLWVVGWVQPQSARRGANNFSDLGLFRKSPGDGGRAWAGDSDLRVGDRGQWRPAPACIIDAPGAGGVVKIGDKVTVAAAGKVALTCPGQGALMCTARIEE